MSEVSVRPFEERDEPAVLELLRASLGGGPIGERSDAFFRWKHLRNPFGRSYMLVAEAAGAVIGLRAFLRWRFEAGGSTVRAVRAVDTATHPRFQGRGVFSTLTREALEALTGSVDLVFNTPNRKSGPGYLKLGWRSVGRLPVWVRPRPRAFLPRASAGAAAPPVRAPSAGEALADEEEVRGLLERAAGRDARLHTARDPGYLRWRYGEPPGLRYHAAVDRGRGGLRGLALFRVRVRGRRWECSVAETIVATDDRGAAGRLLGKVGAACRADHISAVAPAGTAAARAARFRGFLKVPFGPTLMVRLLDTAVVPDPTLRSSWALSLGDLEVF